MRTERLAGAARKRLANAGKPIPQRTLRIVKAEAKKAKTPTTKKASSKKTPQVQTSESPVVVRSKAFKPPTIAYIEDMLDVILDYMHIYRNDPRGVVQATAEEMRLSPGWISTVVRALQKQAAGEEPKEGQKKIGIGPKTAAALGMEVVKQFRRRGYRLPGRR